MITSVDFKSFPSTLEEGSCIEFEIELVTKTASPLLEFTWTVDGKPPVTSPRLVEATGKPPNYTYRFDWTVEHGLTKTALGVTVVETDASGAVAKSSAKATRTFGAAAATMQTSKTAAQVQSLARFLGSGFVERLRQGSFPVSLQRNATGFGSPEDETLWVQILATTKSLAFANYEANMNSNLCPNGARGTKLSGTQAYEALKRESIKFMKDRCVLPPTHDDVVTAAAEALARLGRSINLLKSNQNVPDNVLTAQSHLPLATADLATHVQCWDDHWRDLCLVELIWSYWHEEAMLVQTMKAISRRFQNRRAPSTRDPLANLEIDPLRPLGNVLWGYVGDEVHRLSVLRRAHEYEHHYGLPLDGAAVAQARPADRRSKFLESFHNLLHACVVFYRSDDDNTVTADGFPVLNAIKETHYLIAHGAHNQFGDLPETARHEMLLEQWIMARPEMRDFLRGRAMVPYPEPWMEGVDAMKSLQGWTDTSVIHFRDLGVFGEQILLSVRYGSWAKQTNPTAAVAWARFWRQEVQGYVHAYRAVTGVDLTAEVTGTRLALERDIAPSVHLRRRLGGRLPA